MVYAAHLNYRVRFGWCMRKERYIYSVHIYMYTSWNSKEFAAIEILQFRTGYCTEDPISDSH